VFDAALGLCVLPKMAVIFSARNIVFDCFNRMLNLRKLQKPQFKKNGQYNYSYYPVILRSEEVLLKVKEALLKNNISVRRYFYPSLNQLPFTGKIQSCLVSEDLSKRVLSLPLYDSLPENDVERICAIINENI
jgi:dTDP-4-amino-4,6-dideoxygalactose transaminase